MWNPFWFKTKKRENLRSCPPSAEKRRLPLEGARTSRLSTRYGSKPFIFKRTSHLLGQLRLILFKMKFSSFVSPLRVRLSRWICWPAMYFSGWTLFFCFWPWSNVFFFKIQFEEKVKRFFFAYRVYRPVSFYLHKGTFLFISFPKEIIFVWCNGGQLIETVRLSLEERNSEVWPHRHLYRFQLLNPFCKLLAGLRPAPVQSEVVSQQ